MQTGKTLVTPPMMKRRTNRTELRSMDSYTKISCRFQNSKQKFPPLSPPCTNHSLNPQRMILFSLFGEIKVDYLVQGSESGETFLESI